MTRWVQTVEAANSCWEIGPGLSLTPPHYSWPVCDLRRNHPAGLKSGHLRLHSSSSFVPVSLQFVFVTASLQLDCHRQTCRDWLCTHTHAHTHDWTKHPSQYRAGLACWRLTLSVGEGAVHSQVKWTGRRRPHTLCVFFADSLPAWMLLPPLLLLFEGVLSAWFRLLSEFWLITGALEGGGSSPITFMTAWQGRLPDHDLLSHYAQSMWGVTVVILVWCHLSFCLDCGPSPTDPDH